MFKSQFKIFATINQLTIISRIKKVTIFFKLGNDSVRMSSTLKKKINVTVL